MASVKGKGGMMPKRSEERRRVNEPTISRTKFDEAQLSAQGIDLDPDIPEPGEHWEQHVKDWYLSIRHSPGVIFMYASDWITVWSLMEQYDQGLKPQFVGFADRWNDIAGEMEHVPILERKPQNAAFLAAIFKELRNTTLLGEETRRRIGFEAPALDLTKIQAQDDVDEGVVRDIAEVRRQGLAG